MKKILSLVLVICGSLLIADEPTPEQLENAAQICESGNVETCRNLAGYCFSELKNYDKVVRFGALGCKKGDLYSCSLTGEGYYMLENFTKSKEYHTKVCGTKKTPNDLDKLAKSGSCYRLGVMYGNGQGVRQDFFKAREYLTKACNDKGTEACHNLGVLYHKGKGVRQNLTTAKEYYGKACDLEYQNGCDAYRKLNQAGY